ncbi:MAG: FAD-dependent oxidoreductase [Bdellovibrio sp.]|nr:FAD-dependent oxidoreductase [Bdellovibrio sp.]
MSPNPTSKRISVWSENINMPTLTPLMDNYETDVCIVGGGIAGLTTAYLLSKEGKRVCVLESAELGSGQTGRTTAHFVTAIDNRYFEIEKYHGHKGAQIVAESHAAAISKVKQIVLEEKIACDLENVDGHLFAAGDTRPNILQREFEAAQRAGLKDVKIVDHTPLEFVKTSPSLYFPNQMQLHPLKYLNALARLIIQAGGRIFTNTHVNHVQGGKNAEVRSKDGFTIQCKSIVMATNTPVNDLFAIHTKQAPYRTYVLGFAIPKGSIPNALFWDTLKPYHYIRLARDMNDNDILIVGGEDHKTGQEHHPEARFNALETWVRKRFPMAGELLNSWSGQVMEPVDGVAFLGHNPADRDNVYIITGDSGNGMTHCTIGAMLITDQIMGRKNPWEELYNPSRINLRATAGFMKENANVLAQYADWFGRKSSPNLEKLHTEEGTVYRKGLKMIAAYKNNNNEFSFLSAVCPHLGGIVHWNSVEKSWDCPCHGSRFNKFGKVIEGPAWSDLESIFPQAEKTPTSPTKKIESV